MFQEKAPYEAKAAKRKTDYEKQMVAYNKKQVNISTYFLHVVQFHAHFLLRYIPVYLIIYLFFTSIHLGKHGWRWWWGIRQVQVRGQWRGWRGKWRSKSLETFQFFEYSGFPLFNYSCLGGFYHPFIVFSSKVPILPSFRYISFLLMKYLSYSRTVAGNFSSFLHLICE